MKLKNHKNLRSYPYPMAPITTSPLLSPSHRGNNQLQGEGLFNVPGVALCRCGGSEKKPFC